jgi:hypothetical protein
MRSCIFLVRITTSVFFGLLTFVLLMLWVGSYWRMDQLIRRVSPVEYVAATTMQGQLAIGKANDPALGRVFREEWTRRGFAMKDWDAALSGPVAYFPATRNTRLVPLPKLDRKPFIVQNPARPTWKLRCHIGYSCSCLRPFLVSLGTVAFAFRISHFDNAV